MDNKDYILEEFEQYGADGVDFVSLGWVPYLKSANSKIVLSVTKDEYLNYRVVPKTCREYWKKTEKGHKYYVSLNTHDLIGMLLNDKIDLTNILKLCYHRHIYEPNDILWEIKEYLDKMCCESWLADKLYEEWNASDLMIYLTDRYDVKWKKETRYYMSLSEEK